MLFFIILFFSSQIHMKSPCRIVMSSHDIGLSITVLSITVTGLGVGRPVPTHLLTFLTNCFYSHLLKTIKWCPKKHTFGIIHFSRTHLNPQDGV